MTESEWLDSADPARMLRLYTSDEMPWPRGQPAPIVSDRKLRLFAVACCRQVWHLLTDERSRRAVEVAERYADGEATETELAAACESIPGPPNGLHGALVCCSRHHPIFDAAGVVRALAFDGLGDAAQASMLRDIFGNPFRPVALMPEEPADVFAAIDVLDRELRRNTGATYLPRSILTTTVRDIAQGIYAERAFERMPILGDALEDSGADNEEILRHCRQPGQHVRGCWVVDLILGKE